jgi:hypothetical protein
LPPIALGVAVQWQRPLYPFSLWVVSLAPQSLSEEKLRWLTALRQAASGWNVSGWLGVLTGMVLFTVFRQLYWAAPLAADLSPLPGALRLLGVLWAVLCFMALNLVVHMALTAARLQWLSPGASLAPYAADKVAQDFLILGRRSPKLWLPREPEQSDWLDRLLLQWQRWRHPDRLAVAKLEDRPAGAEVPAQPSAESTPEAIPAPALSETPESDGTQSHQSETAATSTIAVTASSETSETAEAEAVEAPAAGDGGDA